MKKLHFALTVLCFSFLLGANAQTLVNQSVIAGGLGTPPQFYSYIKGVPLPAGGFALLYNVYLTGQQDDYMVIKIDATGNMVGVAEYNSLHNGKDFGTNICAAGNYVYAVGFTMDSTGTNSLTFNTMKIDINTWDTLWTRSENIDSGVGEVPVTVIADDSDNVYVGGTVQTLTDNHMAVVKYAPDGTKLWTTRYNGTYTYTSAVSMALSGRFINATGFSFDGSGHSNFVTAGFDKYTGAFWDDKIDSGGNGMISHPVNIATDQQANSYISGSFTISGIKSVIKTVSYDAAFNQLWVSTWGDSSLTNTASGMVVDLMGLDQNIFITGSTVNSSGLHSMVVLRYTMDGTLQWAKTITATNPAYGTDGVAITTDNIGNSYATGTQYNGTDTDIVTVALDSSGNILWQKIFNSATGANDAPYSILMGGASANSVIVTERSTGSSTDYKLIEYDQEKTYFAPDNNVPSQQWAYYENKGQILDSGTHQASYVHFYTNTSNPRLYLTDTALSYVYSRGDSTNDTLQRIDMTFEKSEIGNSPNPAPLYYANEQITPYLNYYMGGLPEYYENVHGYQRLTAKNIYPNIDWQLYSDSGGLKYYYVVNPGGNPDDIQFLYTGADSISSDTTGLKIYSRFGVTNQLPFTAWQYSGGTATQIHITLSMLSNNECKFTTESYNPSIPLVIRMTQQPLTRSLRSSSNIAWSTYWGGGSGDGGYDIAISKSTGNKYVTGSTSSADFPVTMGLSTNTYGSFGTFVSKFNQADLNVWSDFYGQVGSYSYLGVKPAAIQLSQGLGDAGTEAIVYVTGTTNSTTIPMINMGGGAYYDSIYSGGFSDIVLTRFEAASGQLKHATYIGSNGMDIATSLAVSEPNRLLFLGGGTRGTNWNYFNSSGNTFFDPKGSAVLMEFDINLHMKMSTGFAAPSSYGTLTSYSLIFDIAVDDSNNLIIAGTTDSAFSYSGSNLPLGLPSGSFSQKYPSYPVTREPAAFIAKFTPTSDPLDTTYGLYYYTILTDSVGTGLIGGTYGYHVCTDSKGNLYLLGSSSCNSFPIKPTSSTCPSTNSGMYIAKFSSRGVLQYANLFNSSLGLIEGSNNYTNNTLTWEKIGRAVCDREDNLFIFGNTNTSNGNSLAMVSPAGYYTNYTTGGTFILELDSQQNTMWATMFGSTSLFQNANAGGMALDQSNNLYICGTITASANPDSISQFPIVAESGATNISMINNYNAQSYAYGDAFVTKFQLVNATSTGISTNEGKVGSTTLHCFPNPSNGTFTVDLTQFTGNKLIEMLDQLGRTLFVERTDLDKIQISQSGLSKGIYLVHVTDTNTNLTAKIIIY